MVYIIIKKINHYANTKKLYNITIKYIIYNYIIIYLISTKLKSKKFSFNSIGRYIIKI